MDSINLKKGFAFCYRDRTIQILFEILDHLISSLNEVINATVQKPILSLPLHPPVARTRRRPPPSRPSHSAVSTEPNLLPLLPPN